MKANPNARRFLPKATLRPGTTFGDHGELRVGGEQIDLHHDRGETDDHLWAWLPGRRALMTGDFLIWNFPNAGNPQKVQRYPIEWAAALRKMIAKGPGLLLPAHGLPIAGWASPDDPVIHGGRAAIYLARRKVEPSLMAKGIFAGAARESQAIADTASTPATDD